jgi:hypothetical protein
MSYSFDLAGAINAIAAIEDAITTPTPGIVTSYTYGANPGEFTAPSQLPAIVHVPTGPVVQIGAELSRGQYQIYYDVYSLLLAIEAVPNQYPADETAVTLFWKSILEALLSDSTRSTICTASGAFAYTCIFEPNSYAIRAWPPIGPAPNFYWSLQYTHRFWIIGG